MASRRLVVRERITAIIGSFLLFIILLLSYWYSMRIDIEGLRYVPSEKSPDFVAHDIHLTNFAETGTPVYRASAAVMQHFSDDRIRAENASFLSLKPEDGFASVRANELWSNDALETVDLVGDVRFTRPASEGEPALFARSDRLHGWLDTMHFETDKAVFLQRGNDTTEATEGMVYDNVARTVVLNGNVRSVFHPQDYGAAKKPATQSTAQPDSQKK